MQPFSRDEQAFLLHVAREAMTEAVCGRTWNPSAVAARLSSERLAEPSAAFVSLHRGLHLRGCVGSITAARPLYLAVAESAVSAALRDTRFPPVAPEELPELEIEISVLSSMSPLRPEDVHPGEHGLLVSQGFARGLLLPQVATEYGWTAEQFMEAACQKAGLPADAWRHGARMEGFTALVFSDASVAAGAPRL